MIKDKTRKLYAIDFRDKLSMCSYINSMKKEIDIINITHDNGIYTIYYLEETK
jgi:hypothetical protein